MREQIAVEADIQQFKVDRLDASLRDYALKGEMKGLQAYSVAWDLRVIIREEGGFITIVLLDAGTRSQVY